MCSQFPIIQRMITQHALTHISHTTRDVVTEIQATASDQLFKLDSVLYHPRSLARPMASWRPPHLTLAVGKHRQLKATLSRYRVGPLAQSRIRGYGEQRTPAYAVSVRLTDPAGTPPPMVLAEAWIRAIVPQDMINAVHLIDREDDTAAIYVWLVDANYVPIHSPASMFAGFSKAA